jgi:GNAT superfamily N-acetyltransferase
MTSRSLDDMTLAIHPVTNDRWNDLATLFGRSGADGGCWCMYYRMPASEFTKSTNDRNRRSLRRRIKKGSIPGLIAYLNGDPAGYVGISPREEFPRLQRSRTLHPVDDQPVWSIVCFFIGRRFRSRGLAHDLIRAAIDYVAAHDGNIVEAYPKDVTDNPASDAAAYPGVPSLFQREGFTEVARRTSDKRFRPRPIMRYKIKSSDRKRARRRAAVHR